LLKAPPLAGRYISNDLTRSHWQAAEKVIFPRLLKNGQMQGSRNPEECGVLGSTPQ